MDWEASAGSARVSDNGFYNDTQNTNEPNLFTPGYLPMPFHLHYSQSLLPSNPIKNEILLLLELEVDWTLEAHLVKLEPPS